ncbi:MAG TPA: hypothetical protein VGD13_12685 [Xanthobacteraceae bacterium]|jgi:hypothetical protein
MKVLAYAAAGAVFALAFGTLPVTRAQAMPLDATIGSATDDFAQLTASKRKMRRAGVGGSVRRDMGGRGPGGGLPLGGGTATSPGGLPTVGRGGAGN